MRRQSPSRFTAPNTGTFERRTYPLRRLALNGPFRHPLCSALACLIMLAGCSLRVGYHQTDATACRWTENSLDTQRDRAVDASLEFIPLSASLRYRLSCEADANGVQQEYRIDARLGEATAAIDDNAPLNNADTQRLDGAADQTSVLQPTTTQPATAAATENKICQTLNLLSEVFSRLQQRFDTISTPIPNSGTKSTKPLDASSNSSGECQASTSQPAWPELASSPR